MPARLVLRAKIVLLAAEGKQDIEIARRLSIVPRAGARVFCATVLPGWNTTRPGPAARPHLTGMAALWLPAWSAIVIRSG
jgi:hypothetical protein